MNIPRSEKGAQKRKFKFGGRSIAHQRHNEKHARTLMMSLSMDNKETGLETCWRDRRNLVEICDRSAIIHPVIPVQKQLCESVRFFFTKADASICIGHLLAAYRLQIGRRKVFLKTFSNGWNVHIHDN